MCGSSCAVPDNWDFDDCNNESTLCESGFSTDGSVSVGLSWTANAGCCSEFADLWQDTVDLARVCTVAFDQIGPGSGSPSNSDHIVFIDGVQVKNCGSVNNNQTQTCLVDVSAYTGKHTFRIRWEQQSGDHLGNSKVDHFRVIGSESLEASSIDVSKDTICPGDNVTLSVNGGVLGVGGSWEWYSNGCGVNNIGSGSSINVFPSSDSTFYVRAEGGCKDTTACRSVDLEVEEAAITPDSLVTHPIPEQRMPLCVGDSAELVAHGGNMGLDGEFRWYQEACGDSLIDSNSESSTVSPMVPTDYFVRIESYCNNTPCQSVSIDTALLPFAEPGTSMTTCGEDTVELGGDTIARFGKKPYTYSWSHEETHVDTGRSDSDSYIQVSPNQTVLYERTIRDSNGCRAFAYDTLNITKPYCGEAHVFVPNAFSPNGDGRNDRLRFFGQGVERFHIVIYNRWGEQVFEADSMDEEWDGMRNGQALDPAVFVYHVTGRFDTGEPIDQKGNITLLR